MAAPGALRGVNPGLRPAVDHPCAPARVKPSASHSFIQIQEEHALGNSSVVSQSLQTEPFQFLCQLLAVCMHCYSSHFWAYMRLASSVVTDLRTTGITALWSNPWK